MQTFGLSKHKTITGMVAVAYFAFVTLCHDVMQRPAHWAQRQLGSDRWNTLVIGVAMLPLAVFCFLLLRRLRGHWAGRTAGFYFVASLALAAASFFTLLQVNIEIIHMPQYAILACLLFAITQRFSDAMILATFAGAIDEGWQYFYLHGHWGIYYDFNDVILNAIGAGMGLTAIFILRPHRLPISADAYRRSAIVVTAIVIVGLGLALAAFGVIQIVPITDPDAWAITLRRSAAPITSWLTTEWGQTYHEVQPGAGLAATVALVVLYSALDRARAPETPQG